MPIRKVKGGYKWGSKGKVYKNRKDAERQAAAAYASGYVKKGWREILKKDMSYCVCSGPNKTNGFNKKNRKTIWSHSERKLFLRKFFNVLGKIRTRLWWRSKYRR